MTYFVNIALDPSTKSQLDFYFDFWIIVENKLFGKTHFVQQDQVNTTFMIFIFMKHKCNQQKWSSK